MTHTKLTALRKRVGAASGTASYVALACECIELCEALEAALRVVEHYSADCGDHCKNSCRYCGFRAAYPDLLEGEK